MAIDPTSERGRRLGQHVRILEITIGLKSTNVVVDDLADLLERTPRLYELVLRIRGVHQFDTNTIQRLTHLATHSTVEGSSPLRVRALTILSCGIQSPIVYQLLKIWPSVEFLYIGVELAAPPPKWSPAFHLYQLTLMRTPRQSILSWLLSSSTESLQIVSFRDAPGRDFDSILDTIGPRLRSLRLMNYSLRAAAVLMKCTRLEEFVILQLSTLFALDDLPPTIKHLKCRNMPSEDQSIGSVIHAIGRLPRLRVVTCATQASADERFPDLRNLCASRSIELILDELSLWMVSTAMLDQCSALVSVLILTPFKQREDPVYVDQFPRTKSIANFALMN
ncbi:hypothetical protein ONZ51_g317 [Trametes cubensis]|uniref:Uncharacterized protein n=1 Tax=Trametes cubensis TaxID=1111947 RepID=A0AAD7XE39_9APHY|nr:hypothetical protein ONZ51_g317 [Trametes cubensis]